MTKYHDGCGGILAISGHSYKCQKCNRYTNEIAETKDAALSDNGETDR